MKRHIFLLPLLLIAATGCSSLEGLLAFDAPTPAPVEVEAAPAAMIPATQVEPLPQWCQRVAAKARSDAASSGFDATTQEGLASQQYRQCLTMMQAG